MENRLAGWGILLFVMIVAGVCAVREGTPAPLPETASQELFSADRALVYLKAFATAPHPMGSAEHDRVRDYLVAQLSALGVTPEIQRATGVTPRYEVAGTVENIVARLKGTSGSAGCGRPGRALRFRSRWSGRGRRRRRSGQAA